MCWPRYKFYEHPVQNLIVQKVTSIFSVLQIENEFEVRSTNESKFVLNTFAASAIVLLYYEELF